VQPFSLYVHIPYCDSKCPYCDFNSYAVKRWPEDAYCAALDAEMTAYAAQAPWQDGAVQTIFSAAARVAVRARFHRGADRRASRLWPRATSPIEITMEANPGTVDGAKLRGFAAAGVNRISFGVQSFEPATWRSSAAFTARRKRSMPSRRRAGRASTASTST
jgi:oxygen-independent coproporphyrinogen-3 oxidase